MPSWLTAATNDRVLRNLRTPQDVWLLLRVVSFASIARRLLRTPMPRLLPRVTPSRPRAADHYRAYQTVVFVRSYMQHIGRHRATPCSIQSLTLYHFLRRFGVDVAIHFGLDPSSKQGHAWISLHGEPLLEPVSPQDRYVEMIRYAGPTAAVQAARGTPVVRAHSSH